MKSRISTFSARLSNQEKLVGTFIKSTDYTNIEVLANTSLSVLCLDTEHVPFSRSALDICLLAARAGDMPTLVRIPAARAELALNALDCGASGIMVPHVTSAQEAQAAVNMCHYGSGGRGYAGSTRAAGYTRINAAEHLLNSRSNTTVIAQIEDVDALLCIDEIAAVKGIDCLFIGRADLAVSMGTTDQAHPEVVAAMQVICHAAHSVGRRLGMYLADAAEIPFWEKQGVSLFLVASDHSFLMQGAKNLSR
ncbi:hypothetical protein C7W93_06555 [Glaciimonas sp. PCH181]|nr:hypothetical protein C7W93_06555 [Glaciimonas sp. PCH181]